MIELYEHAGIEPCLLAKRASALSWLASLCLSFIPWKVTSDLWVAIERPVKRMTQSLYAQYIKYVTASFTVLNIDKLLANIQNQLFTMTSNSSRSLHLIPPIWGSKDVLIFETEPLELLLDDVKRLANQGMDRPFQRHLKFDNKVLHYWRSKWKQQQLRLKNQKGRANYWVTNNWIHNFAFGNITWPKFNLFHIKF